MSRNVKIVNFAAILLMLFGGPVESSGQEEGAMPQKHYSITHLNRNINTKFSENGASLIDDTVLLFSSMQEIEDQGQFLEQQPVLMQIYQATISPDGTPSTAATLYSTQINSSSFHTYNATYDKRNKLLYFTYCEASDEGVGHCAIYCASRVGDKWKQIHKVGGCVNSSGNNTHPTIGYQNDGSTLLYFVSDRPGGMGGNDIWYAIIRDGKISNCTNLGSPVNSADNEVTPFYDTINNVLYFSSDHSDGIGEYDVYASLGERDSWDTPLNMGEEVNSPYNDLYFVVTGDNQGYLSSNRRDSFFSTDSSCCTDIYQWKCYYSDNEGTNMVIDSSNHVSGNLKEVFVTSFQESARTLLPISLYFHNDEPDPKSMASTTASTYYQTYNRYMFLRNEYIQAWESENDTTLRRQQQVALEHFFNQEVQGNCDRLESFLFFLSEDLWAGRHVALTLKGYASPLHTSEYNVRLSQRRIVSIINQLREWHGGALRRYLDSGALRITEEAHGSDDAPTPSHTIPYERTPQRYSVYSIEACHERRIDILDYTSF